MSEYLFPFPSSVVIRKIGDAIIMDPKYPLTHQSEFFAKQVLIAPRENLSRRYNPFLYLCDEERKFFIEKAN